jgi:hypothetical protein
LSRTLNEIENLWLEKMRVAREQYVEAQNRVTEAERNIADIPSPDGSFAYRQARKQETQALLKYRDVLVTLKDLLVDRKEPPNEP